MTPKIIDSYVNPINQLSNYQNFLEQFQKMVSWLFNKILVHCDANGSEQFENGHFS